MHIEPGVVTGAKLLLGWATAAGSGAVALHMAWREIRERGAMPLLARIAMTTGLVLCFFEVLPHTTVGVSEVHLILGTTLFLVFGPAAAALGLALGLLVQGLLFVPPDLPQYGMNVTTLLVPLFAVRAVARRIVPPTAAYVDLRWDQLLRLSATYQGGVVSWVVFWTLWGQGVSAANLAAIGSFASAYVIVLVVEPLLDLAVLAAARSFHRLARSPLVDPRLLLPSVRPA